MTLRTCPACGYVTCAHACPVCRSLKTGTAKSRAKRKRQVESIACGLETRRRNKELREGMEALARMIVRFDRA